MATAQQNKIAKIAKKAKEIYNSKGNKLKWTDCIKKAAKQVK